MRLRKFAIDQADRYSRKAYNGKETQIDYIFIKEAIEGQARTMQRYLTDGKTEIFDHTCVILKLNLEGMQRPWEQYWKMNAGLLDDLEFKENFGKYIHTTRESNQA